MDTSTLIKKGTLFTKVIAECNKKNMKNCCPYQGECIGKKCPFKSTIDDICAVVKVVNKNQHAPKPVIKQFTILRAKKENQKKGNESIMPVLMEELADVGRLSVNESRLQKALTDFSADGFVLRPEVY